MYLLDKLYSHLGLHIAQKPVQPEPKGKLVFSCSQRENVMIMIKIVIKQYAIKNVNKTK